jgi:hypothetical protein
LIRKGPGVWEQEEGTRFTVVDLDVFSRRRLSVLATALRASKVRHGYVSVLGGQSQSYEAHFELNSRLDAPADRQIQGLIASIKKLPKPARALWDSAQSREFNIAIEADLEPHCREFKLAPRTIALVAEVRATIVITVYAPEVPPPRRKARKTAR